MLYWPMAQLPNGYATLVVKAKESPAALVPSVKEALASVDPGLPVAQIALLDDVVSDSLRQPRFTSALVGAFALVAAFYEPPSHWNTVSPPNTACSGRSSTSRRDCRSSYGVPCLPERLSGMKEKLDLDGFERKLNPAPSAAQYTGR